MDKKAQEEIAIQLYLTFRFSSGHRKLPECAPYSVPYWDVAGKVIEIVERLGYRKPLDRPELRKEAQSILDDFINAYDKAWLNKSTFGSKQFDKAIAQILALISPKG